MKKKIFCKFSLAIIFVAPLLFLTSFSSNNVNTKDEISSRLSVKSADNNTQVFDLLVQGVTAAGESVFVKKKSLKTPFEREFEKGDYKIIIHRVSQDGVVIGSIEGIRNGEKRVSAKSDDEVIFLTVSESNGVSVTGL